MCERTSTKLGQGELGPGMAEREMKLLAIPTAYVQLSPVGFGQPGLRGQLDGDTPQRVNKLCTRYSQAQPISLSIPRN